MIRRAAILLAVPTLIVVLIAVPLGLWRGEYQWLCAAVALSVILPPSVATMFVAQRLAKATMYGPLLALVVGTFGRLLIGFGGAVIVFFTSKPTFHADPISFWAWILGLYLTTLLVETVLLANRDHKGAGIP